MSIYALVASLLNREGSLTSLKPNVQYQSDSEMKFAPSAFELFSHLEEESNSHQRRKMRHIESNAKCRHLKKLPVKGLCGRCLSVWGQEPHTPPPISHFTLQTCIKYTYSHREGGRGWEMNQREGERGNSSQSWIENTNITGCTSILW
jgi:hypothetical protein